MDDAVKILCVDDEPTVLKALQRLFLDSDYEIITASSGEEGLEVLKNTDGIKLIISDYQMPKMDGIDFMREVYQKRPETVRIVLSGYDDTEAIVEAVNEGQINKFIPKPWNDDELRITVEHALEHFPANLKDIRLNDETESGNEGLTDKLEQAQTKLPQQDRTSSSGQLAAGIAREINNPLGFISNNINTLRHYVSKLKDMLFFYQKAFGKNDDVDKARELADKKWKKLKLDYIFNDADELIAESSDSAERIKKIVSDLNEFFHIDEASSVNIDINREIDRALYILSNEIPLDAKINRDFHSLPLFNCNPSHICQVLFNIILNALQAGREGLTLSISTRCVAGWIKIDITDNGPGIPENIMKRIFEPFYTTKKVGRGNGMGLNLAYETVSSYSGSIEVESREGQGATFSIFLPLAEKETDI